MPYMFSMSYSMRMKLAAKTPPVSENDLFECFQNRTRTAILDLREKHDTDPPTLWFISENDYGRRLKICYVSEAVPVIKTAFVPNADEEKFYLEHSLEL